MLVVDDLGWNDLGYQQNSKSSVNLGEWRTTDVKTPTPIIDRLASEGVRLENHYVQPLCSPTRGTIMTGRYPVHNGIGPSIIGERSPYGVPAGEVFLSEKFKSAGYDTHAIGKVRATTTHPRKASPARLMFMIPRPSQWHLGFCDERYTPTFRGFDSFTGFFSGGTDYWTHQMNHDLLDLRSSVTTRAPRRLPPPKTDARGIYSTHIWRTEVGRILANRRPGTPLFVYLATQSVHSPVQPPDSAVPTFDSYPAPRARREYVGVVKMLDAFVGHVERMYIDAGIWDQTVLVFMSDNGAHVHGGVGNNFPLRGAKGHVWEGGVRGVAFVRGVRDETLAAAGFAVESGGRRTQLMHSVDWLPTLSSVAGFSLDDTKPLDGVDQWTVLAQGGPAKRESVLLNCAKGGVRDGAIRGTRYKLIFAGGVGGKGDRERYSIGTHASLKQLPPLGFEPDAGSVCEPPQPVDGRFLFDILNDPRECNNLAAGQANQTDEVRMLIELFDRYRETASEPLEQLMRGRAASAWRPPEKDEPVLGPYAGRCNSCAWGAERSSLHELYSAWAETRDSLALLPSAPV